MNLRRIVDSVLIGIFRILDSRYPKRPCRGTHKKKDKDGNYIPYDPFKPSTWETKQQIPTREEAVKYCEETDVPRYMAYLRGDRAVKHPHYTGVYYCPYCECWHVTTNDNSTLKENTKKKILRAFHDGFYSRNLPDDGKYCVLLDFPDYSEEQMDEYTASHMKGEKK